MKKFIEILSALPVQETATFVAPKFDASKSTDTAYLVGFGRAVVEAKAEFDRANGATLYDEIEIAIANLLAVEVPAIELGAVIKRIERRYFALNSLLSFTWKDAATSLRLGKGDHFECLAQVFARVRLAKDPAKVAEAMRLAKVAPSCYGAINKAMGVGEQIEVEAEGKVTLVTVEGLLVVAARKWAKSNGLEVVSPKK
jgi:hypothetical protein